MLKCNINKNGLLVSKSGHLNIISIQLFQLCFFVLMQQCSNGPLLEVLLRNALLCAACNENNIQTSISGDLQVNYNNIHKVLQLLRSVIVASGVRFLIATVLLPEILPGIVGAFCGTLEV